MSTTDDGRWTYRVGPHGARVRVRERRRGGNAYLFAYDPELDGNRKTSLGYPVRDPETGRLIKDNVERAKAAAAELSNRLVRGLPAREEEEDEPEEPDATVGRVFDLFRAEEIHDGLSDAHAAALTRGLEAWENFLGREFDLREFGLREWNAFKRQRASGEIDSRGSKVRTPKKRREIAPRTVAKDLKTVRQACRFAERYRDGGGFLLEADPTRGLDLPSESNPRRPVANDRQVELLLEAAEKVRVGHDAHRGREKVRPPLREMIVLAAGTGRRIGAIVRLRWSDWRPDEATYGTLRWRADSDKLGREWTAPVTPEVRETLEGLRRERPGVAEAWIFPAPEADGEHVRVDVAGKWLREAERLAELWEDRERPAGFGWHAFRRMWATKRKHLSSQDVAYAGGWKDTGTLERVYQHADPETTEAVVLGARELRPAAAETAEDGDGYEPGERAAAAGEAGP
jgi:integrase